MKELIYESKGVFIKPKLLLSTNLCDLFVGMRWKMFDKNERSI